MERASFVVGEHRDALVQAEVAVLARARLVDTDQHVVVSFGLAHCGHRAAVQVPPQDRPRVVPPEPGRRAALRELGPQDDPELIRAQAQRQERVGPSRMEGGAHRPPQLVEAPGTAVKRHVDRLRVSPAAKDLVERIRIVGRHVAGRVLDRDGVEGCLGDGGSGRSASGMRRRKRQQYQADPGGGRE